MVRKTLLGATQKKLCARTSVVFISLTLIFPACTTIPTQNQADRVAYDPCADLKAAENAGLLVGALLGAVIGKQFSKSKNAVPIGLLIGGSIGAEIGKGVAKRQCDIFKVAQKNNIKFVTAKLKLPSNLPTAKVSEENVVGMTATLIDKDGATGHFLPGSDQLTPPAKAYFTEIARSYLPEERKNGLSEPERLEVDKAKVIIVGHTDDQENSAKAAELSERRAKAVANVFKNVGVPDKSIYYQGAGETLPIADNNTAASMNRRVEIVDVANDDVMTAFLKSRVSTSTYFRPTPQLGSDGATLPTLSSEANTNPSRAKVAVVPKKQVTPRKPSSQAPVIAKTGVPAVASPDIVAPSSIDFGGNLFNAAQNQVNIGDSFQSEGFSLISVAHADITIASSCVQDRPRIARSVKSLRDSSEYKIGDYRPGAYGASWVGMVGGHLVALNNVAVVRAGGLPASDPNVLIYRNFDKKGGSKRQPDFSATPIVNSYAGSRGLLYRVFFDKGAPLRCIDVVLPEKPPFKVEQGFIYQDKHNQTFAVKFEPEVPAIKS